MEDSVIKEVEESIQSNPEGKYSEYISFGEFVITSKPIPKRLLPIRGEPSQLSYINRTSALPNYPVAMFKYKLLRKHYPRSIFFYTSNYDIDAKTQPPDVVNWVENIYMKEFLKRGSQILLTIFVKGIEENEGHAVAGILTPDKTLFLINTTKTEYSILRDIEYATQKRLGESIKVVDVMSDFTDESGVQFNLQSEEDEIFCVVWMLNALYENGGSSVTLDSLRTYIRYVHKAKVDAGGNVFITNKLNEFKTMYGSGICPCSPDMSDCPRCKKGGALDKMGDCSGGRRRKTARKWIQEVVTNMKKGSFTKQALKHGETPEEYAEDVLKHPKKHTLKTRRRAQFLMNIKKRSTTRKSRK